MTRPLVRALAASLLPAGPGQAVPFDPVLLALMAMPSCGPEQVTDILRTPRPAPAPSPSTWATSSGRGRCSGACRPDGRTGRSLLAPR